MPVVSQSHDDAIPSHDEALEPPLTLLDEFFARYSGFVYNNTRSASHEFYRLCDEFEWDREDPERNEAYDDFRDALVKQFNRLYGTDKNSLGDWQKLCCLVHIDPIPDDLKACRKAVLGTYVNIVDLVDAETTGKAVTVFPSEVALSQYTKSTGKFFPRENAHAGGLLRYLLRQIIHPRKKVPSDRRARRRR